MVETLDKDSRCETLENFYKELGNVAKPKIIKLCREIVSKIRVE